MITQTQENYYFVSNLVLLKFTTSDLHKLCVPTFIKDIKIKYLPYFSSTADNACT